jgi:hypothetical protein
VDQPVLLPSNKAVSDMSIDISGCDDDADKDGKRTRRYNGKWDEKEGICMLSDVYIYVNIYTYIYMYIYIYIYTCI